MGRAWKSFFCLGWLALLEIGCGAAGGPARYRDYAFAVLSHHNVNDYSYQCFLSALKIDESSGALTPVGTWPLASSGLVRALAVDPEGRFLYITRFGEPGDISVFAIEAATGVLTEIVGSPFTAGESPRSLAFDVSGRFAYVLDTPSVWPHLPGIVGFSVDPETGRLEELPGSPFAAGYPTAMAIEPVGGRIYVAGSVPDGETLRRCISAFTINSVTGALTEMAGSPFAVRVAPSSDVNGGLSALAADPSGRLLFGLAYATWNVNSFFIDPQTGRLIEALLSPFNLRTYPEEITVDPSGTFVFVVTETEVCVFEIDAASGTLREAPGSPYSGGSPGPLAVHPSGEFVYIGRWEKVAGATRTSINPYRIDAGTGALTELIDLSSVTEHEVAALTVVRIAQ